MKSATPTKIPNGHGSLYKEVRFSPTSTPIKRSQSVPNDHAAPNRDRKRSFEMAKDTPSALTMGFLEQSRSLLDRQRINFDRERVLFREERQLWEKERELLKLRISELESLLRSRGVSATSATAAAPLTGFSATSPSQVWEGSSPMSRPTRVFPDEEKFDGQLSLVSEQGGGSALPALSLDAALSPLSHATESSAIIPVPIEKLDSSLDGITLKSSALHPDVVARVMTPPSPSSREPSPTSLSQEKASADRRNSIKLKLSDLGPPETNLLRHAGHTPMVSIDRDVDTAQGSPDEAPLFEEGPLTPPVTKARQPAERSDSYFAGVIDLPDDPALKGPLSLVNEEGHDTDFLQEVDQKLLGQVRQFLGHKKEDEEEDVAAGEGEDVSEIKFKNATNFGTAFGQSI
ncbi:hypothetical protein BJX76DRAFT_214844 [Aspergillus varians]